MKSINLTIKYILVIITLISIPSCVKKEGKSMDNNMMIASFPLKGIYITPNTPGSNIPSHGTVNFGETYAIDFVMINENDKLK